MPPAKQGHQNDGVSAESPSLARRVRRWCLRRLFPSIYLHENPFRIVEYKRLLGLTRITKNDRVLDVGCGMGTITSCLAYRAQHAVGIDTDAAVVAIATQLAGRLGSAAAPVSYRCATIEQAAFPDGAFDRVFCLSVLPIVPNYEAIVAECRRVLKPGGELLATFDSLESITDPLLLEQHRNDHKIVQYLRPAAIREAFLRNGFRKVEVYSLFTGRLAHRWFIEAVRSQFTCGRMMVLAQALILNITERLVPAEQPGIRLLVRGTK